MISSKAVIQKQIEKREVNYSQAMWSDTEQSNASRKPSDFDEIPMQNHRLQFADSLKDLKNLRIQLYSAAERFESSYDKNDHKQFVVQLSKDYVAKALVSTVDHLGSVADKLNKFFDEKANLFSATNTRFSCIEQRLRTFEGFIELRGMSQHSLVFEANGHPKHYVVPGAETCPSGKSNEVLRSCITDPPHNEQQPMQDNSVSKDFQRARKKLSDRPLLRKQHSRMPSREQSPNRLNFSFTGVVPNKEAGRRSISPFRFPTNWSGSDSKRSVSPNPSVSKPRCPSEPRRSISACRRQETTKEIESYTSRSKQLFRALISVHRSGK